MKGPRGILHSFLSWPKQASSLFSRVSRHCAGECRNEGERGQGVVACVVAEVQRQQKRAVPRFRCLSRELAQKLARAEPTGYGFYLTSVNPLYNP